MNDATDWKAREGQGSWEQAQRKSVRTLREAVEFAEEGAEHPSFGEVVDEVDPGTGRGDHDVGDGQVDDEVVSGRVHALVACDDEQHGHVADQRQQNHDTVHRRLQRQNIARAGQHRSLTCPSLAFQSVVFVCVHPFCLSSLSLFCYIAIYCVNGGQH